MERNTAVPLATSSMSSPAAAAIKTEYSSSASPSSPSIAADSRSNRHFTRTSGITNNCSLNAAYATLLSTPKKHLLDTVMLQTIRKKLATPGGVFELQSLRLDCTVDSAVKVIQDKYIICARSKHAGESKGQSCYRHLVDMNMSNLVCTDIYTGEQYAVKIINEPFHKVQEAYFKLQLEGEKRCSSIYGHQLIREVHDVVPMDKQRTYIILAAANKNSESSSSPVSEVYEDLHTYLRENHRLCETEARTLFHQICETVLICHRNGIILRDLKLKRFFFIDEARTKLQYESLEGSMILDNPEDDTLSEKIGCPLYTAPELLCPEPKYKGKPADMWALGVILYTMLVGHYPFFVKGNSNLISIIRQCFVQLPGHLSRSARWLLLALLRKNINDRVPIEHIFLSPWLKEQRPFHMYIPVDVEIPVEESLGGNNSMDCEDSDEDVGVQPLDYSCNGLSLNCSYSYAEMG
ncbi:tribbles [Musca vetustissima]|uniref:tribbles n=1 Tax=Musca vetustissima TaxID=27455 RepID=UPI002AB60712|nr:tribbles [Musca vetustissima]